MPEKTKHSGNWFSSLPSLIKAIAVLVTAITALYVALATHGNAGGTKNQKSTLNQDVPPKAPDSKVPAPNAPDPEATDPCKTLPYDQRPISCLDEDKK